MRKPYAERILMSGKITVFTGPMFSEKTTHLLSAYRRSVRGNRTVLVIKPRIDRRYDPEKIISHNGEEVLARLVDKAEGIYDIFGSMKYGIKDVFIDEAQFIPNLSEVLVWLSRTGSNVYVSMLDLKSDGKPFETSSDVFAVADKIVKLTAVCTRCNSDATRSFRKNPEDKGDIVLGGKGEYEAMCLDCFSKNMSEQ